MVIIIVWMSKSLPFPIPYSKVGSCTEGYKGKATIATIPSDCNSMGGSFTVDPTSGSDWGDCMLDVCLLDQPSNDSYVAAQVL